MADACGLLSYPYQRFWYNRRLVTLILVLSLVQTYIGPSPLSPRSNVPHFWTTLDPYVGAEHHASNGLQIFYSHLPFLTKSKASKVFGSSLFTGFTFGQHKILRFWKYSLKSSVQPTHSPVLTSETDNSPWMWCLTSVVAPYLTLSLSPRRTAFKNRRYKSLVRIRDNSSSLCHQITHPRPTHSYLLNLHPSQLLRIII